MDLVTKSYIIHGSQSLPPITSQDNSIFQSHFHSSSTNFPIIPIAVIGILATALLLVSYYVFVIKCCLNWHRLDLLRQRNYDDPLMVDAPAMEARGLDESGIRSIPIVHYKKTEENRGDRSYCECAVCLNEFEEDEKLRIIPNCSHLFHIDCIDVWLQSNANCPLCRIRISISKPTRFDQIIDPNPFSDHTVIGGDEDYVAIELGNVSLSNQSQERSNSSEQLEQRNGKKFEKMRSMGDESIKSERKNEEFIVNPVRRSFSMDSSADSEFNLAIQEAVKKKGEMGEVEGCSSNGVRRSSFFSFGHGGGSRNVILPIYSDK